MVCYGQCCCFIDIGTPFCPTGTMMSKLVDTCCAALLCVCAGGRTSPLSPEGALTLTIVPAPSCGCCRPLPLSFFPALISFFRASFSPNLLSLPGSRNERVMWLQGELVVLSM
jgi:hypothetical protein